MRFRSYDALKVLDAIARHSSFTAAAGELNKSKGAVSYPITKLEADLGFEVFTRERQRLALTQKGRRLWHASQAALAELDAELLFRCPTAPTASPALGRTVAEMGLERAGSFLPSEVGRRNAALTESRFLACAMAYAFMPSR